MPSIQRIARFAAVCGSLALVSASRASAECPENMIMYGCYPDAIAYTFTAPTMTYEGTPWQFGSPCPIGCYDLPHGASHVRVQGNTAGPGCIVGVRTEDTFTIVDFPAGRLVDFYAEFQVIGSISGNGSLAAVVLDAPAGASANHSTSTPNPALRFFVRLPLSHVAGEAFRIRTDLNAGGDFPAGLVVADGFLLFGGLPDGASIQSCQSYELPVPTRPATWGALKSAYR